MINLENYIKSQLREIYHYINYEYVDLYRDGYNKDMQSIFSTLHNLFIVNFRKMNDRLPTGDNIAHFWAAESRDLLFAINIVRGMQRTLKGSALDFAVDEYYEKLIKQVAEFLRSTGGSDIPPHMNKVDLYYKVPIFIKRNSIKIQHADKQRYSALKLIGKGSYAQVFSYYDPFYDKKFALKRALKSLENKELKRFKQEFVQMHSLHSPYIVEVFNYDDKNNEYIMELMDCSLEQFICKNSSKLTTENKKSIAFQILRAFKYTHSKGLLHRDISPKNILMKVYDHALVVKVSDFGLVKVQDSSLTTVNTEFKGYFNDPCLITEGFTNYKMIHETYALTRLIYYVLTGRTNTLQIKNENLREFVHKGMSYEFSERYQSVDEIAAAIRRYDIF